MVLILRHLFLKKLLAKILYQHSFNFFIYSKSYYNNLEILINKNVSLILNEYTRPDWFFAPINQNNHYSWLISCIIQGLAECASLMKQNFIKNLMHCLYHLIECLGNESIIVSQSASSSLLRISYYCDYSNINDMIAQNIDYVIDTIAFKLRHYSFDDINTPLMLNVYYLTFYVFHLRRCLLVLVSIQALYYF